MMKDQGTNKLLVWSCNGADRKAYDSLLDGTWVAPPGWRLLSVQIIQGNAFLTLERKT